MPVAPPAPMTWEVTLAVLCSAVLHAAWNAAIKKGDEPLFETTLVHAWVSLPATIVLPFLPLPGSTAAMCLAGSMLVHCAYYYALSAAYRSGDLSLAYPVMRGSAPMLTALVAGVVLHEWPAPMGWIGVASISVGVLAIGLAGGTRGAGARTADAPDAPDAGARRGRAIGWALLTAATIVAYTLIDSIGARSAPTPWSYVAWLAFLEGPAILAWVLAMRGRPLLDYARRRGPAPMAIGIVSMSAYGIALWAMTRAPVALVAALRETSVLFAMLIAAFVLRERIGTARWSAALAIVAGVAALRLA